MPRHVIINKEYEISEDLSSFVKMIESPRCNFDAMILGHFLFTTPAWREMNIKQLAFITDKSRQTIARYLKQLEEAGYLTRKNK